MDEFRGRQTVRAGSLITTVFGDAVAPRGGTVWLGSLIRVLADFGISERLVRTSVFRLVKDGWLQTRQTGRRSFYSITVEGRQRFEIATHRIYSTPTADWDGRWTLLLLGGLETAEKELARREFGWLGFGALSANVLAHPAPDDTDIRLTLERLGLGDRLAVIRGETVGSDKAITANAHTAWNLEDIDQRYRRFVDMFRVPLRAVSKGGAPSPREAFQLRTLLIQEYRKVLLRDPRLPAELLPVDWHGHEAYQLCGNLYRYIAQAADDWLSEALETEHGSLPVNDAAFYRRFGGIEQKGNG